MSFLEMVRKRGGYRTDGEASRAVNSVFGTAKAWLPPPTSDVMRKLLPGDASRLWRYCPVAFSSTLTGDGNGAGSVQPLQFILRVQQLGGYETSREARRAVGSVVGALAHYLPRGSGRLLGRVFPLELAQANKNAGHSRAGWAA